MKTVCVYHSIDLDGWMSAAIVKHWFLTNHETEDCVVDGEGFEGSSNSEEIQVLDFKGFNYGQDIPDLSEYDRVIMCDVSFPKDDMEKLFYKLGSNFIWIDHHISAMKDIYDEDTRLNAIMGIRDTDYSACELTWKYFFSYEDMPEIVRLLGRYDCFAHKGTDEELTVLQFQYGARQIISGYKSAYNTLYAILCDKCWDCTTREDNIHISGKAIYEYLLVDARQTFSKGFMIAIQGYKFLAINKERFNPINFGINYHGFGYDGVMSFYIDENKIVNVSLYNDNGEVDCSKIAKEYGGGGHKGASGFRMGLYNFQYAFLINL